MDEDHGTELTSNLSLLFMATPWQDAGMYSAVTAAQRHSSALIAERDAAIARADAEQLRRELSDEHEAQARREFEEALAEERAASEKAEGERDELKKALGAEIATSRARLADIQIYQLYQDRIITERDELHAIIASGRESVGKIRDILGAAIYGPTPEDADGADWDAIDEVTLAARAASLIRELRADCETLAHESIFADAAGMVLNLNDAKNYVEIKLEASGGQRYVMTLLRHDGETPHQLRLKAEEQRDRAMAELRSQCARWCGDKPGDCAGCSVRLALADADEPPTTPCPECRSRGQHKLACSRRDEHRVVAIARQVMDEYHEDLAELAGIDEKEEEP